MPQMIPLVLKNAANTDVTFNPQGVPNGVATFVSPTGVPIGDPRITMSHNRTATGRQKVVFKMTVPVVQDVVVNGISKPTVIRSAYAETTITFDGTSNTLERSNLLALWKNLLGSTFGAAMAVDLQDPY